MSLVGAEAKAERLNTQKKKLDENWYEGEVGGKVGIFPVSYVEVLIPLP